MSIGRAVAHVAQQHKLGRVPNNQALVNSVIPVMRSTLPLSSLLSYIYYTMLVAL